MHNQDHMDKELRIGIMEPGNRARREQLAGRLSPGKPGAPPRPEALDLTARKQKLRTVREVTRDNLMALAEDLKTNLTRQTPRVKVHSARDGNNRPAPFSNAEARLFMTSLTLPTREL
jgi:hypothetical protein